MRRLRLPRPQANLVWFDEVDSTNELAGRLMSAWLGGEEGVLPDTVVLAGTQTAGRGRGSNTWQSPPGGLYATWLAWFPLHALTLVPLAAGVALADGIEELLPSVRVGLKWPNDLHVDGRKLGGVLCQSRTREAMTWVMVGFGINVGGDPVLPEGDVIRPTSLRSLGHDGNPEETVATIAGAFPARMRSLLETPASTIAAWKARSVHTRGEWIRLRLPAGAVEGRFAGLSEDGQLELEVNGEVRRFASGEVIQDVAQAGG